MFGETPIAETFIIKGRAATTVNMWLKSPMDHSKHFTARTARGTAKKRKSTKRKR